MNDGTQPIEGRGAVLHRNWWLPLGALLLTAAGFTWSKTASGADVVWGWFAIFFGLTFGPLFLARNAFPLSRTVTYRVTPERVEISGLPPIQNEQILEAKLLPRRSDALVVFTLRNRRPVTLRLPHFQAHAIVNMLGARRSRFTLLIPFWKRFLVALVLIVLASLASVGIASLFFLPGTGLLAGVLAWVFGFVRGRLTIGADGFTTRWFFRERFIRFDDVLGITSVRPMGETHASDAVVTFKKGGKARFRTLEEPNTEEERGTESYAMLGHLLAAFHRSQQLVTEADVPVLVACQSRSARDWLASIDALVRGGGARYRVAAVSPESLVEVATDPKANAESRVGAAAAVVRIGDPALRSRVRIAAEACADTGLRSSLLEIADATDDVHVEGALARFTQK